jgi:hypothetical protein
MQSSCAEPLDQGNGPDGDWPVQQKPGVRNSISRSDKNSDCSVGSSKN